MSSLQLTSTGKLRHFLTIEGLPRDMLVSILDTAESFTSFKDRNIKKVPLLRGKTVANLFFEPSTRTRTTFELAAKRLSADVLNIAMSTSATTKGESLLDTLRNLEAMHVDMFVVRQRKAVLPILLPSRLPHMSALLTPVTAGMPTLPRQCWMSLPFAVTNRILVG